MALGGARLARLRHYRDCGQTNVAPRLTSQLQPADFSRIGVQLARSENGHHPVAARPGRRQAVRAGTPGGWPWHSGARLVFTRNFAFDAPSMTR
jgi:hypothetical protein